MKEAIKEKNLINNKTRLVAGYCYELKTKKNINSSESDIEFPECILE